MVHTKYTKSLLLTVILLSLPLLGLGCKGGDLNAQRAAKPVTLKIWGVWDEQDLYQDIFDKYKQTHPNVSFEYRKLRVEEYERALLEAWAENRGPDIFMVHNTWINAYQNKLEPLPATISLPSQTVQGTFKKEVVWTFKNFSTLTSSQIDEKFVNVVKKDVVKDDKIYALPMGLDTLALYYNVDIFNDAGLATPPATWAEFKQAVQKITRLDENNNIARSAVAMGRTDNVERGLDLLSVLMMQNGAQMTGPDTLPTFDKTPPGGSADYNPGQQALIFYTDYANPIKEVYTWNQDFPNSLEAFSQGRTAMMFGYSYHEAQIRAKGPKINFRISSLPQIDLLAKKYNFANYWLFGVSPRGDQQVKDTAWDFILYATTDPEQNQTYLDKSGKPPALKSLIAKVQDNPNASPFTLQTLTAESWYQGYNPTAAEEIMKQLVTAINQGNFSDLKALLKNSVEQLKQTYLKPSYGN
jgi:ABC-type glycerol-3-phosphate transport system substrate-binding protein